MKNEGTEGRERKEEREEKEGSKQNNNRNKLQMYLIHKYTVLNKSHWICQG